MMNVIRHILLFFSLFLGWGATILHSQSLMEDLEHIRSILREPDHFYAEIEIRIDYGDAIKDENLPSVINTVIKIDEGNYFFENEMASMVINSDWVVGAIHRQKQIVYGRNNSEELAKARKLAISKNLPIDPAFVGKASLVGKTGTIAHYRISRPDEVIKQIDLYIDSETRFFQKVVYEYADPSRAGVARTTTVFKKIDTRASFESSSFSERLFLIFSENRATPVAKYKGYRILFTDPQLLKDF